jgi:hypothetical protein
MSEKGRIRRGTPEWKETVERLQGRSGAAEESSKGLVRGRRRGGVQRDLGDDAATILQRAGLGHFLQEPGGARFELRFHPVRQWRYDLTYADPFSGWGGFVPFVGSGTAKHRMIREELQGGAVVVDVDGGMATTGMAWGDHVNPDGYDNDRDKDFEAQLLGFVVVRISKRQMNDVDGEYGMVEKVRRALKAKGLLPNAS